MIFADQSFDPFCDWSPFAASRGGSLETVHTAYIGLGGNLASWAGPPDATLAAAAARLETLGRVTGRSSLYSTEPVGFAEQPRFVNAVIALETDLSPHELLNHLLAIEQQFGRDRTKSFANGPRTLDLDILLFDNVKVSEPGLEIPHARMAERRFVLAPLFEVATLLGDAARIETVSQWLESIQKKDGSDPGSDPDAVVAIESAGWRAGAGGDGLQPKSP
jgi:2-amino-4-hydroxy-6-hydroxymethyldihydropteridine diphosphokinase